MGAISIETPEHPGRVQFLARAANLRRPADMPDENQFIQATNDFLGLLRESGVPHVLVGGLALRLHVAARNTDDMNFILAAPDLMRLTGLKMFEQTKWFAAATYGPLKVDFLLTANPLFEEVRSKHSEEHSYQGRSIRCATALGLVVLKLYALPSLYRQGRIDRADLYETDITMLLRAHSATDDAIMDILRPHLADHDEYAIREVLADIRRRLGRAGLA
jgi:hypothetical protein